MDLPELKEGDPAPGASYFNLLRKLIYRALRVNVADGSGLESTSGDDGTVIGGPGSDWSWAKGPSAGITAGGGTGSAQLYLDDGATRLGPTVTVKNPTPDPVPGNRLLLVRLRSRTVWSWSCNPIPS